ncbi:Kelch repeat-containing protein [Stigmatella aurantiaca]|uniref:Conserved uncharacterized protein n=1 Tax=Stigmatella aurantiaca (strain DW4/3-1) TaxID=378806 RepID=Q09CB8_STIAD|nr:kelch repeat-containing protein [Stigmatella aurantiaca]ADO69570.1 conserved uncharacterized protein [Stigmatella aurantiaca DW4/3-1]EAU69383.1 conserved hypothetical protein [Stigmatella aurantiaca DW4/3-1]
MTAFRPAAFLPLLLAVLSGCDSIPPPETATGSAQFAVSLPQTLSSSDVTRVEVTVSASGMSSVVVGLARSNGSWGGLIGNLPAGVNRSFLAQAFDSSGTLSFQGEASGVTLSANQTTVVALILQEVSPPPPYSNEAPLIDSLVVSATSVQTGAPLSLSATAHDPNPGDTIALAWTASAGIFSAPTTATTSWTAPSSTGIQTLTLTVTDSQGTATSISLTVNVVSGAATGNAALHISFNLWPTVSKVSSSLNRLDAGQSTAVFVLAADADGDALTYSWAASCPGTWANATSSSASFVPSAIPSDTCNNCRLTVTVQDGRGGQTTGALALCIASASTPRFPPSFSNFYQSATSTSPGQTVVFEVNALDPQSSALSFAWSATTGSLATPTTGASTSRVVWTAPSCVSAGAPPSIVATVTNAFGLTATQSFTLAGLPPCVLGWNPTGAMSSPRANHTATLLPSGKVLVAGGLSSSSGYLATAEVYDPVTGTWSVTGSMASVRAHHTATLLPSGKVLVAGGGNGIGSPAAAELYDPATGTWSTTGSMSAPRYLHTATLLPTGKVLIAGGALGSGYPVKVEVYDPATGTWSTTGSMASSRAYHPATLLPDGKVLVSGGINGGHLSKAEVYNPATGTWSATGSMSSPHMYHPAALLPNGKVLIAGGHSGTSYLAKAEVYDPATGTWSAAGSMASPRCYQPATLLPSGKVLVSGGTNGGYLATTEVYDPATNTWSAAGSMSSARNYHTATRLPNGKVLVSGGIHGSGYLATAEVFSP